MEVPNSINSSPNSDSDSSSSSIFYSNSSSNSNAIKEQSRDWLELPTDVLLTILAKFDVEEILKTKQFVCRLWYNMCKDPSLWRSIDIQSYGEFDLFQMYENMTRVAVDRSCGGLHDICIEYFGNDDLLLYIVDRSPQLKCLRLQCGYTISGEALVQAVRKLPLLEEIEITLCSFSEDDIQEIGRSCLLLKSFKLNSRGTRNMELAGDEEARAIAESMPGLRHLQLIGNAMTNYGLQAIIDSCVHLESLDLRACFHVDLSGDLGKRIMKQMKEFRHPNDRYTGDYRFRTTVYDSDLDELMHGDVHGEFDDIDFLSDDYDYEFSDMSEFIDDDDDDFDDYVIGGQLAF